MMAERLAEIRDMAQYAPWGSLPMVRELLDHIAQLEAQRGEAVVVAAKMDDDDWEAIGFQQSTEGQIQRVWDRAVSRIQPIPADRVLADGMLGVDREELDALNQIASSVTLPPKGCARILDVDWAEAANGRRNLDALRSAKGEVEG